MFGLTDAVGRAATRAASHAAVCLLAVCAGTTVGKAETRSLKLYNLHTHEKEEIAYKRNGRYVPEGLKKINWILRDWRKKQPTNMDPRLLDLVWEAYRQAGSRSYIQVICGYRSPSTNGMLRSRSSGVAKESQHVLGKALDFTLPDVSLAKLRAIGLKMQVGGVGYYPKSGSPFVHFDIGNVRHWPKMSRKELLAVFPNGNTMHVPSDGKPLPGYEQAVASYKSRKSSSSVLVANAGAAPAGGGGGKTLMAMLFGGGADEEEDTAQAAPTKAAPAKAAPAIEKQDAKPAAKEEAPVARDAAPAKETAVAALAPKREPLPAGVPLPIRDTFDTSAPKTMVPPAELSGPEKQDAVEVAALDLARIPLPSAAPVRETSLVAEAMKVPVPSRPANAAQPSEETSLIAALESAPSAADVAANEAGQLAYSVPMPRGRPPFASILKGETPSARSIEDVLAIAEAGAVDAPSVSEPATTVAALALPASHPVQPARAAKEKTQFAAIEVPNAPVPVAAAKVAVPVGKTARFKRRGAASGTVLAAPVVRISQDAINARIRTADLVTDPNQRSEVSRMVRPDAGRLVRNAPTSVLAAGFTDERATPVADGFAGSAVNFMPMIKID